MKFVLFVLLFGIATTSIHAQIYYDTDDEVSDLLNLIYDHNFARKDTSRLLVQFNLGQSSFKSDKPISNDFSPSIHYDIKLMFKFVKNPKLINGAIGIQFSESMFDLGDQYADISEEGGRFSVGVTNCATEIRPGERRKHSRLCLRHMPNNAQIQVVNFPESFMGFARIFPKLCNWGAVALPAPSPTSYTYDLKNNNLLCRRFKLSLLK